MEKYTSVPVYTVFSYYHSNFIHGAIDREGNEIKLPWMEFPNHARKSVDGNQGIVTGIYEISGAIHITQQEAEKLMLSPEWSNQEA